MAVMYSFFCKLIHQLKGILIGCGAVPEQSWCAPSPNLPVALHHSCCYVYNVYQLVFGHLTDDQISSTLLSSINLSIP